MKKYLSMLMVLLILLSLAGCSSGEASGNTGKDIAVSDTEGDAADDETAAEKTSDDVDAVGKMGEDNNASRAEALNNVALMGGVPASEENAKRSSYSASADNLCLRFGSRTRGYNVIRINEPGIGAPFTMEDGYLVNDTFRLNTLNYSEYQFCDLWDCDYITLRITDMSLEYTSESSSLVKQSGDWYLFHYTEADHWRTCLAIPGEYYIIDVLSDAITDEQFIALFDRLSAQTEIGGIEYDEWGNVILTSVNSQDTTFKDLSDWRFLEDMISDYYGSIGLHHQSAPSICGYLNWGARYVTSDRRFFYDGEVNPGSFEVYLITSDEFTEASAEAETYPVTIAAFDKAYVRKDGRGATVFAKTGDSYFRIESWVPFTGTDSIWKTAAAFDQVFY